MTTPEMSERGKLIEHLMSAEFMSQGIYFDASNETKGYCRWNINKVVDFIIADRARIVEPLVEFNNARAGDTYEEEYRLAQKAIGASLRRAGRTQ